MGWLNAREDNNPKKRKYKERIQNLSSNKDLTHSNQICDIQPINLRLRFPHPIGRPRNCFRPRARIGRRTICFAPGTPSPHWLSRIVSEALVAPIGRRALRRRCQSYVTHFCQKRLEQHYFAVDFVSLNRFKPTKTLQNTNVFLKTHFRNLSCNFAPRSGFL